MIYCAAISGSMICCGALDWNSKNCLVFVSVGGNTVELLQSSKSQAKLTRTELCRAICCIAASESVALSRPRRTKKKQEFRS